MANITAARAAAAPAAPRFCIACERPPNRSFLLRNGAWLLRCPRCGLGWWDWPAFDPAAFYDRDYFQSPDAARGYNDYQSLEPGVRRTARARLRRIGKLVKSRSLPIRLLELGCGTGLFLDEARRSGWETQGIEVSAYGVEQARRRGLSVECGPVEGRSFEPAAYDCVALWDVIEHLRDPAGVLRAAGRALRPGGVLALSTGDLTSLCARLSGPRWHLFNLPEHLFFFSPLALRTLLIHAGCRVQAVTREINWVPVSYLTERLQKSLAGGDSTKDPALRPVRNGRSRQWVVPATLLDVLGVYAVRQGPP